MEAADDITSPPSAWPIISLDSVQEELRRLKNTSNSYENEYSKAEADGFHSVMGNSTTNATSNSTMQAKIESVAKQTLSMQWEIAATKKKINSLLDLSKVTQSAVMNHLNTKGDALQCSTTVSIPGEWKHPDNSDIFLAAHESSQIIDIVESKLAALRSATTSEEYQAVLRQEFDEASSLKIPLAWLKKSPKTATTVSRGPRLGTVGEVLPEEEYQDGKDLQRDQILLNGVLHQGSSGVNGYADIVDAVTESLITAVKEVTQVKVSSRDDYVALAKRILHVANRTESGGAAYEALDHLFLSGASEGINAPEFVIIRPNSVEAKPLGISISVGPYERRTADDLAWGFRIVIDATTAYKICDYHDPTAELLDVSATYVKRLVMSPELCPFTNLGTDRASWQDGGYINCNFAGPP